MQPPTVREVIRLPCNRHPNIRRLESEGFVNVRTVGDHRRYAKGCREVTVAGRPGEHLHPKTWKSIQEQAGW